MELQQTAVYGTGWPSTVDNYRVILDLHIWLGIIFSQVLIYVCIWNLGRTLLLNSNAKTTAVMTAVFGPLSQWRTPS